MELLKNHASHVKYYKRVEALKEGLHRHICFRCGMCWSHEGRKVINKTQAHRCPRCRIYNNLITFAEWDVDVNNWIG